jgi:hypothetical protein
MYRHSETSECGIDRCDWWSQTLKQVETATGQDCDWPGNKCGATLLAGISQLPSTYKKYNHSFHSCQVRVVELQIVYLFWYSYVEAPFF